MRLAEGPLHRGHPRLCFMLWAGVKVHPTIAGTLPYRRMNRGIRHRNNKSRNLPPGRSRRRAGSFVATATDWSCNYLRAKLVIATLVCTRQPRWIFHFDVFEVFPFLYWKRYDIIVISRNYWFDNERIFSHQYSTISYINQRNS